MSEKYHQAFSKNAWFKKKNTFFFNFEAFTLLFLNLLSYSFLNQWWNTKVYELILLSWQKVSLAVMFNWIYVRFGKSNITSKHCWFSILNLLFICWIKMKKKILVKGVLIYILTFLRLNCNNNLYINETCEF